MSAGIHHFSQVSLLVTHYNRSASLYCLLQAFEGLNCRFGGIVVSDDGSKPEHVKRLKELQQYYKFQLITAPVNKGLGNNINKGQDAVKTPYTLYVQEDFVPKSEFAEHFKDALAFMEQEESLDIVRFYSYFAYPYLKPYGKGFSEMVFKPMIWFANHLKFYYYSDHPHLRRSNFLEKFGRYSEGQTGDVTEFDMCLSFIKKKGRGLFFNNFTDIFDQKNSADEPSTMNRSDWRQSKNAFVLFLRAIYLQYRLFKNTLQLILTK